MRIPIIPRCPPVVASLSILDVDHQIASWFHGHLNSTMIQGLQGLSQPGCALWIVSVTVIATILLAAKRRWYPLFALLLSVPGGALLGEGIKLIVQRPRPYLAGPSGVWGGYSFPSGHTISATLLYGFMALWLPLALKSSRWRRLPFLLAGLLVLGVAFSRVALGAHYVTDVVGAMVLGCAWLALCWFFVTTLRRYWPRGEDTPKEMVVTSLLQN